MFKNLGLILKPILKVSAECTQYVLDSLVSLIVNQEAQIPSQSDGGIYLRTGSYFCTLFRGEGAAVPCCSLKSVLLTWHPKDAHLS